MEDSAHSGSLANQLVVLGYSLLSLQRRHLDSPLPHQLQRGRGDLKATPTWTSVGAAPCTAHL